MAFTKRGNLSARLERIALELDRASPKELTPLPYKFAFRDYQAQHESDIISKQVKRSIKLWPRRSGKDRTDWLQVVSDSCTNRGLYYYILPTYSQCKKIIWNSISKDGLKFLDHIPPDRIDNINSTELKITLFNGSIIQCVGSDRIDSLMGTSPRGIVFSEASLQAPQAWDYLRPILLENGGWARFNGTPRGKNWYYDLYQMAKENPEWHTSLLTVEDIGHISLEDIQAERDAGMSEDMIQQEFYCSFTRGQEGSFYGKALAELELDGRYTRVPHDPYARVDTFWDLGVGDSTAIIFAQYIDNEIHIIDHYESHGEGLDHYAKVLSEKKYRYSQHYAPHDIQVRELCSGARTRLEIARDLGINFDVVRNVSIYEGVELARSVIPKCWIDDQKCKYLLKCLLNYVKRFNEAYNVYSDAPLHNWASHSADAFRMLGLTYSQPQSDGTSLRQIEWEEKQYRKFT
jgi:phage terminase large subunit